MFSALLRPSLGARCASVVGVNAIRTPLTQCVALSTTADQADETTVGNGRDPVKMYNMISGIEEVLKNPIYTPSRYSYPLLRHLDLKQLKSSTTQSADDVDDTGLPSFESLSINPSEYLLEEGDRKVAEGMSVTLPMEPLDINPQQVIAEQMNSIHEKVEMKRTRNRRPLKPSRLVITGQEFHPMNVWFLSRFVRKSGRIITRKESGLTAKQHRKLARTIRKSRQLGFMAHDSQFHMGPLANAPEEVFPEGAKQHPLLPPLNIVTETEFFSATPKRVIRYRPKDLPIRSSGNREYAFPVDEPTTGIELYDLSKTFDKMQEAAKSRRRSFH